MHRLPSLSTLLLIAALPACAEVPALLQDSVTACGLNSGHWAYTLKTIVRGRADTIKEETVARYDPSRPRDEQWMLLTRNGRPVSPGDIRKYRREMADRHEKRRTLGEFIEWDKAVATGESATAVTYTVPLSEENPWWFPAEKFGVAIRVNKQTRGFETIEVRLLGPMHVALFAKVKNVGADLKFSPIDPLHGPVLSAIRLSGQGSIMFIGISGGYEQTRTDFQRVTPGDSHEVKFGSMKFLDF